MEDENNVTSNITSEAEPQEDLVPKMGNRNSTIWLWFGLKSQTPTRQQ